jgi:hypothetical protein
MSHAYSWSHTIDNASGRRVSSRNDPRQDRGNADTDLRHRYVLTVIYELPWRGRLRGGWGVSGLATFQSGLPDSVVEPEDRCLCATGNIRADATGVPVQYLEAREGRNNWFDGAGGGSTTAGANPYFRRVGTGASWAAGAGRYGNAGRNTLRRPGVNNWNLAGFKRTRVRERQQLELRAEWFNAFNHTQFLTPNTNIGSTLFGRVTATRDPRIVQLGLRYVF